VHSAKLFFNERFWERESIGYLICIYAASEKQQKKTENVLNENKSVCSSGHVLFFQADFFYDWRYGTLQINNSVTEDKKKVLI